MKKTKQFDLRKIPKDMRDCIFSMSESALFDGYIAVKLKGVEKPLHLQNTQQLIFAITIFCPKEKRKEK